MPNRMLRDWTDSEKVHSLSAEAERFFTRLIMKADDYGRYHADTKLLRAYLFPLYAGAIKETKIQQWLNECEAADLIFCYEVNGKKYLEIKLFEQKLKVRRSKYPPSNEEDRMELIEGYVYIIGTTYQKPVKIGFSANPWSRLKEITANHPEPLEILLTIRGEKRLESLLQKELREFRVKNEWFQLNPELVQLFLSFSQAEMTREDMFVGIRSISSLLRKSAEYEEEKEVEVEKGSRKEKEIPNGIGAVEPAPPLPEKVYKELSKDKRSITDFIKNHHPKFIDPFADLWNLFAEEKKLAKISKITDDRKKKFRVRIQETGFDFLTILKKASQSEFLLTGGKWFGFDWIFENEKNYIKVIEGNYDKGAEKNLPAPTIPKKTGPVTMEDQIHFLYGRFMEGADITMLIKKDHYDFLTARDYIKVGSFADQEGETFEQKEKNAVLSYFKQLQSQQKTMKHAS